MLIFQLFLQIPEIFFQKAIDQYIKDCSTLFKKKKKLTAFVNINKKPVYPICYFRHF